MKKKTRWVQPLLLLSALALSGIAMAATPAERMTQGKIAVELGDHVRAERVFQELASDDAAPEAIRAEALVRLGVVDRLLGKPEASTVAFQRAMRSPGRDAESTRLLTLAVAGVATDRSAWASQWPKVQLGTAATAAGPRPVIQWPGPQPKGVREAFPATDPVSFDLEEGSLTAFLYKLFTGTPPGRPLDLFENWPRAYQPPAPVQRLEFLIAIRGPQDPRVTVKASSLPWNELFENVLGSNGLGFVLEDNRLVIGRIEDLGDLDRLRGRVYGGGPVSFTVIGAGLGDLFQILGNASSVELVPDPAAPWQRAGAGQRMFGLRVSQQPALEVLDLLLAAHGLAVTRTAPASDAKPGPTALRVCKLSDVDGEAVDLSKLGR